MKRALVFIPIVLGLVWNVGLRSPRLNTAHEEVTSGVTDDPLPATSARKPASTFKPLRPRITDEAPATSAASIATTINSRESLSTNEHIATSSSLVEITRTETNGGAPQTAPKELIHLCRSNMSEIVWGANAWAKAIYPTICQTT